MRIVTYAFRLIVSINVDIYFWSLEKILSTCARGGRVLIDAENLGIYRQGE